MLLENISASLGVSLPCADQRCVCSFHYTGHPTLTRAGKVDAWPSLLPEEIINSKTRTPSHAQDLTSSESEGNAAVKPVFTTPLPLDPPHLRGSLSRLFMERFPPLTFPPPLRKALHTEGTPGSIPSPANNPCPEIQVTVGVKPKGGSRLSWKVARALLWPQKTTREGGTPSWVTGPTQAAGSPLLCGSWLTG